MIDNGTLIKNIASGLLEYDRESKKNLYRDLSFHTKKGLSVFVGDSITEFYPLNDFFSGYSVTNRGIGGDKTSDVLARIDDIIAIAPKQIFLLIGTNDLGDSVPVTEIAVNIEKICEKISSQLFDTQIYVLSVLPVNADKKTIYGIVLPRTNEDITELNERISKINNVRFIDVGSALKDGQGRLKEELTDDGLHVNVAGYAIISEIIKPYL